MLISFCEQHFDVNVLSVVPLQGFAVSVQACVFHAMFVFRYTLSRLRSCKIGHATSCLFPITISAGSRTGSYCASSPPCSPTSKPAASIFCAGCRRRIRSRKYVMCFDPRISSAPANGDACDYRTSIDIYRFLGMQMQCAFVCCDTRQFVYQVGACSNGFG